jgi:hypothetical protein
MDLLSLIAIALCITCAAVFQISFIHLLLLGLLRIGIALIIVEDLLRLHDLKIFYLSSTISFCFGMLFVYFIFWHRTHLSSMADQHTLTNIDSGTKGFLLASAVFVMFICYHYSVSGIPVLYHDFDIRRFQVISSGLLGIPSRIAVYGPKILLLFTLSYYIAGGLSFKTAFLLLSGCLILLLLLGHKSAMLTFVFLLICAYRFYTSAQRSAF